MLSKTDSQKWLLILPWHWILPFWIQITKVTDIKPGGSKQMHQFQFENHKPYYPQDFPWSYDGWQYNKLVGEANQIKAAKLPKSQVSVQQSEKNYSVIFNANKCDWTNLRNMVLLMKYSKMDRKTVKKIQDNQILHNMMVLRESSTLFMIYCKLQSHLKMMLPT